MLNPKRLKIVKSLNNINEKQKLSLFLKYKNNKANSNYIDLICNDKEYDLKQKEAKLEQMIENILEYEFSKNIKNIKSYDFLVDSIIHNLKRKNLDNLNK